MRKHFTLIAASVLALSAQGTVKQTPVSLAPGGSTSPSPKTEEPCTVRSGVRPAPLCYKPQNAAVSREQELLFEDFSHVPDGATEPVAKIGDRYTDFIASRNYEPGRYVDPTYTPATGTWEGNWVYAGHGGRVILQNYNPMSAAVLNTPLGDYSGDITVTVRCRSAKVFWGSDDTESGYTTSPGSALTVTPCYGGYDRPYYAETDIEYNGQISSGQLYAADGWVELTYTFRNESADSDGFLQFGTNGSIEIDWIRITDAATFLPEPAVRPVTDFREDGFTINWDPVRRSYNYYIDLWKVNFTADSDFNDLYTFDTPDAPQGSCTGNVTVTEGIGKDGSKAVTIAGNGPENAFVSETYPGPLGTLDFDLAIVLEDDSDDEYGTLRIQGLRDGEWVPVASVEIDDFYRSRRFYPFSLSGNNFAAQFQALRFFMEDMAETNYVALDDIRVWGPRPYTLERVEGENSGMSEPGNDDDPYNYYVFLSHGAPCSYTFTALDPQTEYWYRVRSHNVNDFSKSTKHHAFGVADPVLKEADAITGDSFTARWDDVAKAQEYVVRCYRADKAEDDDPSYVVFGEEFGGCEGPEDVMGLTPAGNDEECQLDEYTDMRGWSGVRNAVGQNMLGVEMFSQGHLVSPILPLNPARGDYELYIVAAGFPGDELCLWLTASDRYYYIPFDDNGVIEGVLPVDGPVAGERVNFVSYNDFPFALRRFEVSQALKKGDLIPVFDSEQTVEAGVGSCSFSSLEENKLYAYQVLARYTFDQQTTISQSPRMMLVDLAAGNSQLYSSVRNAVEEPVVELGRYNLQGVPVGSNYRGIVIVRMSDGTARKVVNK